MISITMQSKALKFIYYFFGISVWIILWGILSNYVFESFLFPTPRDTLREFSRLLTEKHFYITVLRSVGRILIGLILGIFFGCALGVMSYYVKPLYYTLYPLISAVRATPVASVIIILWFILSKASLPIIISLMMVAPIIWQSTLDAMNSKDALLYEVADAYELGYRKKLRLLLLPKITEFLIPAIITSIGLAWKSGIAAEIITMAKNSIGKEIANAKNLFSFAEMFAWTLAVVLLSLILESTIKLLLKKVREMDADC